MTRTQDDLIEQIKHLEADRQKHAAAVAEIDLVLNRIDQALKELHASSPQTEGAAPAQRHKVEARVTIPGRAHRYRKLHLTGEKSIVEFVKSRNGATTAEINGHWRTEGRGGLANNAIGQLLRRGELVREPIPGRRGSRYRWRGDRESAAQHNRGGATATEQASAETSTLPSGAAAELPA